MIRYSVGDRRPRDRFGMREAVRVPAIGDGGVVAGGGGGSVRGENDVVVVVNIEGDLVEILLQIGNGSPHDFEILLRKNTKSE